MKTIRILLIALVAATLITSSSKAGFFDGIKEKAGDFADGFKYGFNKAQEKTGDMFDVAKDKAGDLADGVKHMVEAINPPPEPPTIITSVADSRFKSKGKVLTLTNNKSEKIYCIVKASSSQEVKGETINQTEHFLVELKPFKQANIGWLQGWIFEKDDQVEITSDQFPKINLTIK